MKKNKKHLIEHFIGHSIKNLTGHLIAPLIVPLVAVLLILAAATPAASQPAFSARENQGRSELPIKRLALFSSGVGFFEHSGRINGTSTSPFQIYLPFSLNVINDVLKSLAINDPLSDSPSVQYPSSETLIQTLKSLSVDLSGNPGIAEILNSLKGAEIEISGPSNVLRGRIIGVEYRTISGAGRDYYAGGMEAWLNLLTSEGIRSIAIRDIANFTIMDEKINADLNRALDLIMNSRDNQSRNLLLTLPGAGSRDISISYVIPVPVWKISYRLDLAGANPLLQGWAIVDNDSDTDWENVELSLVTGRPVSFIQNLYEPYRTNRPVLPLAIAGIAGSRTYESGYDMAFADESVYSMMEMSRSAPMAAAPMPAPSVQQSGGRTESNLAGGAIQTAAGNNAGDQFEFTFLKPVNLERRQSAMLPLIESSVKAEKTLVLSGSGLSQGMTVNPAISTELTNTTGMKLPAGPITVYDGGTYAGDALIEFFPENEKRIISYGEDLSVTGSLTSSNSRTITAVTISGGVMTIVRRQDYEKIYTVRNASGTEKKIIIEHPITYGTSLSEPAAFSERTGSLYRFSRELPANGELKLTVREEMPVSETISLIQMRQETFLSYSTNQEIPASVRSALAAAIELRRRTDEATAILQDLETQKGRLVSEQDRIRRNIEAAGNQSLQGQEYLKRLAALDAEIDAANAEIDRAQQNLQSARQQYDNYIAALEIHG